jgi:hypothetical protein
MMLCLILLSVACAAQPPQILTEYKILRLTRLVFVPIRESMTAPVPIEYAPDGPVDTITLRTTLQACQTRTQQCNGRLGEIAGVQGTVTGDDH